MFTKDAFRYETVFARIKTDIEIALSTKSCFNLKFQWNWQSKIRDHEKSENLNDAA